MSKEQFDRIVTAILDGKYSWACILFLRFAGCDPLKYIPYATYNRLAKENSQLEKERMVLEEKYLTSQELLLNNFRSSLQLSEPIQLENQLTGERDGKQNLLDKQIYRCQCSICQRQEDVPEKKAHLQMNIFLSRLNEQQKRWYVALEAQKLGHGGTKQMSSITGIHPDTIRRGRKELDALLEGRPVERVRSIGGGRRLKNKEILKKN